MHEQQLKILLLVIIIALLAYLIYKHKQQQEKFELLTKIGKKANQYIQTGAGYLGDAVEGVLGGTDVIYEDAKSAVKAGWKRLIA